ncbi:hypothetical protein T4C_9638, partial [Trichinella pseudospiralis]
LYAQCGLHTTTDPKITVLILNTKMNLEIPDSH